MSFVVLFLRTTVVARCEYWPYDRDAFNKLTNEYHFMVTQMISKLRLATTVLLFASGLLGIPSFAQTWGDGLYHEGMHDMMWGGKLPTVNVVGKAVVDTTAMVSGGMGYMSMWRYYIDTVGTGNRSYQLFFGPYWYQPKSGAHRPINGQTLTIRGGRSIQGLPPVLVVYEINGKIWRDSTGAPPWSGR